MKSSQRNGTTGSCGELSVAGMIFTVRMPGTGDPGGRGGVIGVFSTTAWYAAVRGLPRGRDLSNRILIHHSTMSQSRGGSSMSLAKSILSQNVRRVQVCKRRLPPTRDRKVRSGTVVVLFKVVCGEEDMSGCLNTCDEGLLSFCDAALHFESDFPHHSDKFTRQGDLDLVVMEHSFPQIGASQIQSVLRGPRTFLDPA